MQRTDLEGRRIPIIRRPIPRRWYFGRTAMGPMPSTSYSFPSSALMTDVASTMFPDDAAAVDGDCIQLRDEGRTDAHDMEQVMFIAAGDEIVPERFSRDMFRFGMV